MTQGEIRSASKTKLAALYLIVILGIIAIVWITTPHSKTVSSSGMIKYTDTEYGFSFMYPANMQLDLITHSSNEDQPVGVETLNIHNPQGWGVGINVGPRANYPLTFEELMNTKNDEGGTLYQFVLAESQMNKTILASTTVNNVPAFERKFDCANIKTVPNVPHSLMIETVKDGVPYLFSLGGDFCENPENIKIFEFIISTFHFNDRSVSAAR